MIIWVYYYIVFHICCFLLRTNRRRPHRRLAQGCGITLRSLVVRSTARTQHFDKFLTIVWSLLGSSGMCLEGLRRSLGPFVVKILLSSWMVQKVSGKVQEDPRRVLGVPQTLLKCVSCFLFFICLTYTCIHGIIWFWTYMFIHIFIYVC